MSAVLRWRNPVCEYLIHFRNRSVWKVLLLSLCTFEPHGQGPCALRTVHDPTFLYTTPLSLTIPHFSLSLVLLFYFSSLIFPSCWILVCVCVCVCVCVYVCCRPWWPWGSVTLAPGSQSYSVCVKMSAMQAGPLLFSPRQGWGSRINWAEWWCKV